MPRLFVGVALPDEIAAHLELLGGGIPGARWEPRDKLHLTVRFIGELDGGQARDVAGALERVDAPSFRLALAGVGHFPPRGKPRIVWAGVEDPTEVVDLNRRVERVLLTAGLDAERRKYHPHVTLARLKNAPPAKVAAFMTHHALFRSAAFDIGAFALYSSVLSPGGSKYRIEQRFALGRE